VQRVHHDNVTIDLKYKMMLSMCECHTHTIHLPIQHILVK
jgi:hypothetical protein